MKTIIHRTLKTLLILLNSILSSEEIFSKTLVFFDEAK